MPENPLKTFRRLFEKLFSEESEDLAAPEPSDPRHPEFHDVEPSEPESEMSLPDPPRTLPSSEEDEPLADTPEPLSPPPESHTELPETEEVPEGPKEARIEPPSPGVSEPPEEDDEDERFRRVVREEWEQANERKFRLGKPPIPMPNILIDEIAEEDAETLERADVPKAPEAPGETTPPEAPEEAPEAPRDAPEVASAEEAPEPMDSSFDPPEVGSTWVSTHEGRTFHRPEGGIESAEHLEELVESGEAFEVEEAGVREPLSPPDVPETPEPIDSPKVNFDPPMPGSPPSEGDFSFDDPLGYGQRSKQITDEELGNYHQIQEIERQRRNNQETQHQWNQEVMSMLERIAADLANDARHVQLINGGFQRSRQTLTDTNL